MAVNAKAVISIGVNSQEWQEFMADFQKRKG